MKTWKEKDWEIKYTSTNGRVKIVTVSAETISEALKKVKDSAEQGIHHCIRK